MYTRTKAALIKRRRAAAGCAWCFCGALRGCGLTVAGFALTALRTRTPVYFDYIDDSYVAVAFYTHYDVHNCVDDNIWLWPSQRNMMYAVTT